MYLIKYSDHIGSVAFGSLLIAILWIIQCILAYVKKEMKEKSNFK